MAALATPSSVSRLEEEMLVVHGGFRGLALVGGKVLKKLPRRLKHVVPPLAKWKLETDLATQCQAIGHGK